MKNQWPSDKEKKLEQMKILLKEFEQFIESAIDIACDSIHEDFNDELEFLVAAAETFIQTK